MRFIEKIRKNSNGSITIFVLTSLLFVLVVIGVFYVGISNKNVNQTKIINQIENEYLENSNDNVINKRYNEVIENPEKIY